MNGQNILQGAEAIIFDMDGVIVDSESIHVEAEKAACQHFGIEIPFSEWDGFKGKTAIDIACHILNTYSKGGVSPQQFVECKTRLYLELAATGLQEIEGAIRFIKGAQSLFGLCALTTSSNRAIQELVFDRFDLERYFDEVLTGDEVANGKPHPEPYLKTALKLGVRPSHCIVIEDSDNGVTSAKSAGCRTIGITTSYPSPRLYNCGADLVVESFAELAAIFAGCAKEGV
ncbi:HAD family phosphatase [Candidatus Falkowbacteria bacterium]|nr:HAD family phosphatase [Candidatus Falkowbacteria bacterium]